MIKLLVLVPNERSPTGRMDKNHQVRTGGIAAENPGKRLRSATRQAQALPLLTRPVAHAYPMRLPGLAASLKRK